MLRTPVMDMAAFENILWLILRIPLSLIPCYESVRISLSRKRFSFIYVCAFQEPEVPFRGLTRAPGEGRDGDSNVCEWQVTSIELDLVAPQVHMTTI